MTIPILPKRYVFLGLRPILGCVLLCVLILSSASAQVQNAKCENTSAELENRNADYASLLFCLPHEIVVEPASAVEESDYSTGREVRASLLLNGSHVVLHLLYPCLPPKTQLTPEELKSILIEFDPVMSQATYSDSLISISGLPAPWGQIGSQIFAIFQPANNSIALVLLDQNISESIMVDFLEGLQIAVRPDSTPLVPGYCSDNTTISTAKDQLTKNLSSQTVSQTSRAEDKKSEYELKREKMESARKAALAKLDEQRKAMKMSP